MVVVSCVICIGYASYGCWQWGQIKWPEGSIVLVLVYRDMSKGGSCDPIVQLSHWHIPQGRTKGDHVAIYPIYACGIFHP